MRQSCNVDGREIHRTEAYISVKKTISPPLPLWNDFFPSHVTLKFISHTPFLPLVRPLLHLFYFFISVFPSSFVFLPFSLSLCFFSPFLCPPDIFSPKMTSVNINLLLGDEGTCGLYFPTQCCGSGSGIRYLFALRIRDPGSGIGFFRIPDPTITSESLKHFFYFE